MNHKQKLEAAIDVLNTVECGNDGDIRDEGVEMIQDVADQLDPKSLSPVDSLLPALGTIDWENERAVRKIQTAIMYMKNIGEKNTEFLCNVIDGNILSTDEVFQVIGIYSAMQLAGLHQTYAGFRQTSMTAEQSMHAMVEAIINYHPMTIKQLADEKEN